ncbi:YidB family protein [Geomonas anaerohicana]|uniref:YidB family protein n=1 Tax=Geomonas anaerohicana TaxID=2798583 RepID=UPI001F353744|nr:YidB family protein [Geomonas anaerohicana]
MGILDDVAGKVRGMAGGGDAGLMQGIIEMLTDRQSGGLGGIIQAFNQKGLGHIISSWIDTGPNLPVTPNQLHEVLGPERVQQLANQAGLSTDETVTKLTRFLPDAVDQATPDGKVPEGGPRRQGSRLPEEQILVAWGLAPPGACPLWGLVSRLSRNERSAKGTGTETEPVPSAPPPP